jgi:membrane associated rhomboid family serine protease
MDPRERREDILELDVAPEHLTDRIRQQIVDMLEKPLRLWERLLVALVAVSTLAGSVVICSMLLLRIDLDAAQRFYLFAALLLGVLGAVWSLSVLRRGVLRPATDDVLVEGVVWAFFAVVVCWELFVDRGEGAMTDVIAAIVLVGFPFTWGRVRAAELRTRETMLRIALHSLERDQDAAPGSTQGGSGGIATPLSGF